VKCRVRCTQFLHRPRRRPSSSAERFGRRRLRGRDPFPFQFFNRARYRARARPRFLKAAGEKTDGKTRTSTSTSARTIGRLINPSENLGVMLPGEVSREAPGFGRSLTLPGASPRNRSHHRPSSSIAFLADRPTATMTTVGQPGSRVVRESAYGRFGGRRIETFPKRLGFKRMLQGPIPGGG